MCALHEQCGSSAIPFTRLLAAALAGVPAETSVRELWRALGEAGLIEALFADGARPSSAFLGALLAALDARFPIGVTLGICVQVGSALPILLDSGGDDLGVVRHDALAGKAMVALAATDEAAAGSDLMDAATILTGTDDGEIVEGGKLWITNAAQADQLLVLARCRQDRHFTSFAWVLVPRDAPGVSVRPATTTFFRGAGLGHISFDAVRVTAEQVVGRRGYALPSFARYISVERLAGALWATALTRRVIESTCQWLTTPSAAGPSRWDDQVARHRFARCLVEQQRAESLCAQLSSQVGGPDGQRAAMVLKAGVAMSTDLILSECASLQGAHAWADGGLAWLRAEAGMFGVAGGTTDALLDGIASYPPCPVTTS
jgi:acyl-CoA dehydrogenase